MARGRRDGILCTDAPSGEHNRESGGFAAGHLRMGLDVLALGGGLALGLLAHPISKLVRRTAKGGDRSTTSSTGGGAAAYESKRVGALVYGLPCWVVVCG